LFVAVDDLNWDAGWPNDSLVVAHFVVAGVHSHCAYFACSVGQDVVHDFVDWHVDVIVVEFEGGPLDLHAFVGLATNAFVAVADFDLNGFEVFVVVAVWDVVERHQVAEIVEIGQCLDDETPEYDHRRPVLAVNANSRHVVERNDCFDVACRVVDRTVHTAVDRRPHLLAAGTVVAPQDTYRVHSVVDSVAKHVETVVAVPKVAEVVSHNLAAVATCQPSYFVVTDIEVSGDRVAGIRSSVVVDRRLVTVSAFVIAVTLLVDVDARNRPLGTHRDYFVVVVVPVCPNPSNHSNPLPPHVGHSLNTYCRRVFGILDIVAVVVAGDEGYDGGHKHPLLLRLLRHQPHPLEDPFHVVPLDRTCNTDPFKVEGTY
jgi:hypothetical protein